MRVERRQLTNAELSRITSPNLVFRRVRVAPQEKPLAQRDFAGDASKGNATPKGATPPGVIGDDLD